MSNPFAQADPLSVQTPEFIAVLKQLIAKYAPVPAQYSEPSGTIKLFGGSTPPTGYLTCDGSPVSRTTYAALFAAIGTTYGAGDGSTTFNIPDCRGKVIVGYSASDTNFNALGKTGGEDTHLLTLSELPASLIYNSSASPGLSTQQTGLGFSINGAGTAHNNLQPYITMNAIIKT